MLTLYRRHLGACPHKSRSFKSCRCPIWVQGTLGGESVRKSLDLTSWNRATQVLAEWIEAGEIGSSLEVPTIKESVDKYLSDAKARHLAPATVSKLSYLFNQLVLFSTKKGYRYLRQLSPAVLTEWRGEWKDSPLAASKKHERVAGFFGFCVRNKWLKENPMKGLKPPKAESAEVVPFEKEELESIFEAVKKYPIKGIYGEGNRTRLRAFLLVLRFTGLRISDVVSLRREAIKDGRLLLRTKKTKSVVRLPLPPEVIESLDKLEGEYYFWSGLGKLKSAVSDWQRSLRTLFKIAGIKDGYPHKFRSTLAVELLSQGVPIEIVAAILGNSVQICLKHYSPWVKSRQDSLEEKIKGIWG